MRTLRHIIIVVLSALLTASTVFGQDVTVTVTPVQQILPPQLMLYVSEPANYFNITLSNTGKDDENIYLVMQIEQTNPSTGLGLSTPSKRQPKMPIVVPAGSTRILTPAEIRGLFNHIPMNEIKAPAGIFDNYADGSFGLLPEGQYELHLTAYHWDLLSEPYPVSSPTGGMAMFEVCYKAQAPQFLTPTVPGASLELDPLSVAELDPLNPQFTWKAPVVSCNPLAMSYNYVVRIVELLPGQYPDQSMDYNTVVYQSAELTTPMFMIPHSVIKQMKSDKTYAAQVTATPANSNNRMLNYVSIENKGKSTYKLFRVKSETPQVDSEEGKVPEPKVEDHTDKDQEEADKKDDKSGSKDEEKDEDEEDDISVTMGDVKTSEIVEDSLYTFRNPKIVDPYFQSTAGARKRFVESGIEVAWERPRYVGGEGQQNDTIKIEYEVQLFNNGERADREDAVQQEPIYTFHTTEQKDTIQWEDIAEKVEAGDYMLLRINPVVAHGSSVAFTGDDNVVDFAMMNRLSKQYFQCSATTEIESTKPTTKSASDLKGKEVSIGEYVMTIDEISGNGTDGFKGKGRVQWEPFGSKIMVCVTFDKLKINTDDVVYEGIATSETAPTMSSNKDCVDQLFSEWGIDNLIGDTGIPYASQLQGAATSGVKSLAEEINLSQYYQAIQDGQGLYELLTTGGMEKLYTPIKFPTEVLPKGWDVVDIQIADMKFAPTYATMNIIGQSKLPECDVLKSKLLVFGAPRVCISPNRFLPESGHIALLGDFTLAPSSDFEITFKAPKDVLEPTDGCYISWHADTLELLGIDADMKVAGIVKDVNGKATSERPVMNLQASFGSWNDFLVDNISIEDFQVEDLPGWTFTAKDIVYDHSDTRNSLHMGSFPKRYSKSKAGIKGNDEKWHGLHIGEIGVKFPKSLELGVESGDEDKRLSIKGEEMYFDQSGVTLKMTAEEIFSAKTGTMGGWGISLDKAQLQIIQDDFDNCMFAGQLNVPLFGSKEKKKDDKGKEKFGNVDYTCEIRRLTDPRPRSALTEAVDATALQQTRYSYVFLTEQVDDLNFNCFVADVNIDHKQTYFLIEAYDHESIADSTVTQVELCMGGTINIGGSDKANEWLKKKTASLPLEVKIPDIHFTKMRLSNVARDDWHSISELGENKRKERVAREQEVEKEIKKSLIHATLIESDEMKLGSSFYLDLGEWSLASAKKRLGPFSFNLDKFKPSLSGSSLKMEVSGTIGLLEDKINVGAGITISAKLDMPGTDISKWSIGDGDIDFDTLGLDLDFTAIHLKGGLKVIKNDKNKGYKGDLDISVTGFFTVGCTGGYFEHESDASSEQGMKEDGINTTGMSAGDKKYSWGYFMVKFESSTGIHADPVVINRISGGFFFNCRPTDGKGDNDKFSGDPVAQYGVIGVALGMKLSTTAGEKTLSADMDLMVCYDRKNKCLSTFMFNGKMEAVGGIIKAKASLIYENQKNQAGQTQNRYLCLNVTVEAGADTKEMIASVTKANTALQNVKESMSKFQAGIDNAYKTVTTNPTQGLKQLSGKYDGDKSVEVAEDDMEDEATTEQSEEAKKDLGITAMRTKISLEFKVTWVKDGKTYGTPKWHLYLGEPEKDKRCSFTYLKFDGKIVSVDIGADGYICLGNELPNNGALPAIPAEITEFLAGHKDANTDMGADLGKAERSRKRAAQALLGDNINGGVMVGASAWGKISIDLGLLYGKLEAIAGFDASLVNYGNSAFCVNSGKPMGKNGWYAMGQLYAYLGAELGIHVKIGSLINERIHILRAGIGGVLEMGLPNPTWVEGQARIKISLLGGLCKINKKFEFSAGDHCVPFKGNALDGFEMFQGVSVGSDSLYQALMDPTFAVTLNEAKNMTFTTTSSIGSHYRLVDPSWADELADRDESQSEEDVKERIAMNASRTYVFDVDTKNVDYKGVRIFDLGEEPTNWVTSRNKVSESDFYQMMGYKSGNVYNYSNVKQFFASRFSSRDKTVEELSLIMKNKEQKKGAIDRPLKGSWIDYFTSFLDSEVAGYGITNVGNAEVTASTREDKGTTFHIQSSNLKAGHSYAIVLTADAYEIDNGRRVWCSYVDESKGKEHRIHWKQAKVWFFRIKGSSEDVIQTDSLRNLEPYIALAYPSTNGTKVVEKGSSVTRAYYEDILNPTIALTRDISTAVPETKMKWRLSFITQNGDTIVKTKDAYYNKEGNYINLEPKSAFSDSDNPFNALRSTSIDNAREWDYNSELYHLELVYTYSNTKGKYYDSKTRKYVTPDSTFNLVDLWLTSLPHGVKVDNNTYTDSWKQTTTKDVSEVLPYSYPFVGARIDETPTISYEENYNLTNGAKHSLTDYDYAFTNIGYQTYGAPYRRIDPYMYFAYLGKWVFIGDRQISPYAFDEVGVQFASETLIFEYNGTIVNPEFLKDVSKNKTLLELRNQMYDVWNTGYHRQPGTYPKYPLPAMGKLVGGLTSGNQDGKTSTVTPRYVRLTKDNTYSFRGMVEDYTAVYDLADDLCAELKRESEALTSRYFDSYYRYRSKNAVNKDFGEKQFQAQVNADIRSYNQTKRGKYIEVEKRGYKIRIPYYQLPLIYGDTHGDGARYDGGNFPINLNGKSQNRTFSCSIGSGDFESASDGESGLTLKNRWKSDISDLFFFRLNESADGGQEPGWYYNGESIRHEAYHNNVETSGSKLVTWDKFRKDLGLKAVTDFKALIYRVNAYDTSTGIYMVRKRGGKLDEEVVNVAKATDSSGNSGLDAFLKEGDSQDQHKSTHFDTPQPQCRIYQMPNRKWCLNFWYSDLMPHYSDTWVGEAALDSMPWRSNAKYIGKVEIDPSFKNAPLSSTKDWFRGFEYLEEIVGIENLNMSKVTDMSGMFYGCKRLKGDFDFSKWNTGRVTDMSAMFQDCSGITSLNLTGWRTTNVTDMHCMFANCGNLKTIKGLNKFASRKVKDVTAMFYDCSNLQNGDEDGIVNLPFLYSDELTSTYAMFENCRSVKKIGLANIKGEKLTNTARMFRNTQTLENLWLHNLVCKKENLTDELYYGRMFEYMNADANVTINYDLIDIIKDQIPSAHQIVSQYDKSYQVIHGKPSNASYDILVFLRDENTSFKAGQTASLKLGGSQYSTDISIKNVWSGGSVMRSKNAPWRNVIGDIGKVYILPSFDQSPEYTTGWFCHASKLYEIWGLENLHTERVTDMQAMFADCHVQELDLSHLNTSKVTNMKSMFSESRSLSSLDLSAFDTEQVTDMSDMFCYCTNLTNLKFSEKFNTKNVKNMLEMFAQCHSITQIGDDNFVLNTESVEDMTRMYSNCKRLKKAPKFSSTSKVKKMDTMFSFCENLDKVDFSEYDLSSVESMTNLFVSCTYLSTVDFSNFNAKSTCNFRDAFARVRKYCTIYIPYDAPANMLAQCPISDFPNLTLLYPVTALRYRTGGNAEMTFLGKNMALKVGDKYNGYTIDGVWNGSKVITGEHPWTSDNEYPVTKVIIDVSFKNVPLKKAYKFFSFDSGKLRSIEGLGNMNTSNLTSLSNMFDGCGELTSLDLSKWDTQKVSEMTNLFRGCAKLSEIKPFTSEQGTTGNFTTKRVSNMEGMFKGCSALSAIKHQFESDVYSLSLKGMFEGCSNLKSVDLSKIKANIWSIDGLFKGCKSLQSVDISKFNMSDQTQMKDIFRDCESLETIDLSNLDLMRITDMDGAFSGCTGLRKLVIGAFPPAVAESLPEPPAMTGDDAIDQWAMIEYDMMMWGGIQLQTTINKAKDGAFEKVHDVVVITPADKMDDVRTIFTDRLGFIEDVTGSFFDQEPEKVAQAIWTAEDKTLTFLYGMPVGDYYNDKKVTQRWTGDEVLNSGDNGPQWNPTSSVSSSSGGTQGMRVMKISIKKLVEKVVFENSFAAARPTSTMNWFSGMSKLKEIQNLKNLNTSAVRNMARMFAECSKLEEIDLSNFSTSQVTDMNYMFYAVPVKSLDVSGFNTTNVVNMTRMFGQCEKLAKLDLSNFNTRNVTEATAIFNGCSSLRRMKVSQNCIFSKLTNKKQNCFTGVKDMEITVNSSYMEAVRNSFINDLGFVDAYYGTTTTTSTESSGSSGSGSTSGHISLSGGTYTGGTISTTGGTSSSTSGTTSSTTSVTTGTIPRGGVLKRIR